jgi:hypothetical protein
MHSPSKSLLICNPLQKSGELPLFVVGDSREQCLRMLAGDAAYDVKRRAPFFREVQSITPAVIRILAPFD